MSTGQVAWARKPGAKTGLNVTRMLKGMSRQRAWMLANAPVSHPVLAFSCSAQDCLPLLASRKASARWCSAKDCLPLPASGKSYVTFASHLHEISRCVSGNCLVNRRCFTDSCCLCVSNTQITKRDGTNQIIFLHHNLISPQGCIFVTIELKVAS